MNKATVVVSVFGMVLAGMACKCKVVVDCQTSIAVLEQQAKMETVNRAVIQRKQHQLELEMMSSKANAKEEEMTQLKLNFDCVLTLMEERELENITLLAANELLESE